MARTLEKVLSRCSQVGECLVWEGALNSDGYPAAFPSVKLHRWVCSQFHNIEGLVVRHTCDNIKCLNPQHLIPGTVADNVRDMDLRGRRYRVITPEIISEVKTLLSEGLLQKDIAEIVGIDSRRVSDINRGVYNESANLTKYLKEV